jgi:hypothetical protein
VLFDLLYGHRRLRVLRLAQAHDAQHSIETLERRLRDGDVPLPDGSGVDGGIQKQVARENIPFAKAVAMDMWDPYIASTVAHVPDGRSKIVFDRFHIMKQMNHALDRVRLAEHRKLSGWGCDLLKGSKHFWLYASENVPDRYRVRFGELKERNLQTSRAWAIKETLRDLWSYRSMTWGKKFFDKWFGWAKRSKLTPVKKYRLTPGHAGIYQDGTIHSIDYPDSARFIRVTGTNLDNIQRVRFDLATGKVHQMTPQQAT